MHAETYIRILPYFQYICKLFDFKFLQKKKKKAFWESKEFSDNLNLHFFTFEYIFNLYIILLYFCSIYT